MKLWWFIFVLILAGCATGLNNKIPPVPTPPTVSNYWSRRPPPPVENNKWIVWDNDNPIEDWPFIVADVWSTTNLMHPFTHKFMIGPMTNGFKLVPSLTQEFYIVRFYQTNTGEFSDWSRKTN